MRHRAGGQPEVASTSPLGTRLPVVQAPTRKIVVGKVARPGHPGLCPDFAYRRFSRAFNQVLGHGASAVFPLRAMLQEVSLFALGFGP